MLQTQQHQQQHWRHLQQMMSGDTACGPYYKLFHNRLVVVLPMHGMHFTEMHWQHTFG